MTAIIPIQDGIRAYLVKTCNGKYYHQYLKESRIDHYKYPLGTASGVAEHDLFYTMKKQDLIVMSGYRHQRVMLGVLEDSAPTLKVRWLQEVMTSRLPQLYPYLYRKTPVCDISAMLPALIRHVYACFAYDGQYHLVVQVEQERPIRLKSLLGLEKLVLDEAKGKPLAIKVQLESPGLIEFISEHRDVILSIFRLILILLQFKAKREVKKEYQALYDLYCRYSLDELQLNVRKTVKFSKNDDNG
ncbi:MAG TPA: hypothetical protein VIK63_07185 [Haloplasmataceae bacterium]